MAITTGVGGLEGVPIGTITLEITHRCHRRCAFCYVPGLIGAESPAPEELSAEQLCRLANQVVDRTGCQHVQLSGGEPLLRRDLLSIVEGIKSRGVRVSIITDGAQLDESSAASLVRQGVSAVQPTVLAGEAELHDSLRGPGAFRQVTRAMAAAASAGLAVNVCMVITNQNWHQAARVAQLAFALGARGLALSRFCPAGAASGQASTLMPEARQVRACAEAAAQACRAVGLPLATAVTIPACVWKDPEHPPLAVGRCSLVGPKATVTISPDGSLRSCSLSTTIVGNLLTEPWEVLARRLWEQELEPLRHAEICTACPHWQRCLGGCRLSALSVFGDLNHPDPLAPNRDGNS